jgi:hypothetical protein
MSLTYQWKLRSLKKADTSSFDNVVVETSWDCIGTDQNGVFGVYNGVTQFNPFDVDGDSFVAYEDLTEAIVLDWIYTTFVGNYKDHIDLLITRQIDEKKLSPVEVPQSQLPWSTETTTP